MKILRVNTFDQGGGAEKIAWALFDAERRAGHLSRLVVTEKRSRDPDVLEALRPPEPGAWGRWMLRVMQRLKPIHHPGSERGRALYTRLPSALQRLAGVEVFDFPATYRLFELAGFRPDLLHLHNLHHQYGYFDLRALPFFSRQLPVVVTLHDAWLLSGHCAHSLACPRWQTGCGRCPDLSIYPPVRRDATAHNWQVKRRIYQRSRVYIATPSRWLMDKVQRSILQPASVEARVISEGIDTDAFHPPADQAEARRQLGLPPEQPILLFTASGIRANPFKDYQTLRRAFERLAQQSPTPVLLLALGEAGPSEFIQGAELRFIPFQSRPERVAQYYQAADLYLHAARADTFPSTVLEALACGLPVVASAVGGIPEQVQEGQTGFLVPPGNAETLAGQTLRLLAEPELRRGLGRQAAADARRRFDQRGMIAAYQGWFEEMIAGWQPG